MVKVNFELSRRNVVLVFVVVGLLVGAGFAVAYSNDWKSDDGVTNVTVETNTAIHGHSPDEVVLVIPTGTPTDLVNGAIWIE